MGHNTAKEYDEMRVGRGFYKFLKANGVPVDDIRPNPNDPPDLFIDTKDGMVIGLEVGAGYYDSQDAKDMWSVLRGQPEKSSRYLRPGEPVPEAVRRIAAARPPYGVMVNFTGGLIESLQTTLTKKCAGSATQPACLILDATKAVLTTGEDAPEIIAALQVPVSHPYDRGIFLAVTTNGTDMEFLKL